MGLLGPGAVAGRCWAAAAATRGKDLMSKQTTCTFLRPRQGAAQQGFACDRTAELLQSLFTCAEVDRGFPWIPRQFTLPTCPSCYPKQCQLAPVRLLVRHAAPAAGSKVRPTVGSWCADPRPLWPAKQAPQHRLCAQGTLPVTALPCPEGPPPPAAAAAAAPGQSYCGCSGSGRWGG